MADNKFIADAEAAHNQRRASHGVPPLIHNKNLSKMAQNWAAHIAMRNCLSHSAKESRKYKGEHCGENCAMSYTSYGADFSGEQVIAEWYSEIKDYNFNRHAGPNTSHFTQVVWKNSREFGIGKAKSRDGAWYVVANYHPAGNFIGHNPENVFPLRRSYDPTAKSSSAASFPSEAMGNIRTNYTIRSQPTSAKTIALSNLTVSIIPTEYSGRSNSASTRTFTGQNGAWYGVGNYHFAGNFNGTNDRNAFHAGKPNSYKVKTSPAAFFSSAVMGNVQTKYSNRSKSTSTRSFTGPDGKTVTKKITTETVIDQHGNEAKTVTEEVINS